MGHVFISYSHKDSDYAHDLADSLQVEGLEVWIDERLDYGSQWPHEIQRQLDTCDAFILLMSPRSFESDWVQSELQRAKRKRKPIFPLLLEGDEPWLSVESTQYYDVRNGELPDSRFYSAVKRGISAGSVAEGAGNVQQAVRRKTAQPEPKMRTEFIVAIIGGIATVIAACATIIGAPLINQWFNARDASLPTPTLSASTITTLVEGVTQENPPLTVPATEAQGPVAASPPTQTELPPTVVVLPPTDFPTPTKTPIPVPTIALYGWWSPSREDNFATAHPEWDGSKKNYVADPDYELSRLEGYIFTAKLPQPANTVALYTWYSSDRGDNLLTSHPNWVGSDGDTRDPDYVFARLEGYIYSPDLPQPPNTRPLYRWWSPLRGDNFTTTNPAWDASQTNYMGNPDYEFVRLEGYVGEP